MYSGHRPDFFSPISLFCFRCEKSFSNVQELNEHQRNHGQHFFPVESGISLGGAEAREVCRYCKRKFVRSTAFHAHLSACLQHYEEQNKKTSLKLPKKDETKPGAFIASSEKNRPDIFIDRKKFPNCIDGRPWNEHQHMEFHRGTSWKFAGFIKQNLKSFLSMSSAEVSFTLDYITYMSEWLEVGTIKDDDARVDLRGQQGVFAKKDIPTDTFLGIFSGEYLDLNKLGVEKKLMDDLDAQSYSLGIKSKLKGIPYSININGALGDHITKKFNANRCGKSGRPREANIDWVMVHYGNCPLAVFRSIKEIKIQQELLLDYGEDYWKTLKEAEDRLKIN